MPVRHNPPTRVSKHPFFCLGNVLYQGCPEKCVVESLSELAAKVDDVKGHVLDVKDLAADLQASMERNFELLLEHHGISKDPGGGGNNFLACPISHRLSNVTSSFWF